MWFRRPTQSVRGLVSHLLAGAGALVLIVALLGCGSRGALPAVGLGLSGTWLLEIQPGGDCPDLVDRTTLLLFEDAQGRLAGAACVLDLERNRRIRVSLHLQVDEEDSVSGTATTCLPYVLADVQCRDDRAVDCGTFLLEGDRSGDRITGIFWTPGDADPCASGTFRLTRI